MLLNVAFVIVGALMVLAVVNDVFQSVIVPRAVGRRLRLSFYLWRGVWRVWPSLAWKLYPSGEEGRENMLAVFAPGMLVALLMYWFVLLVFGYGAIFWGLRGELRPVPHGYGDTAYFAGVALTTVGFGDIVGHSIGARLVSLLAASTGVGLVAVVTAYLFALFAAFQVREAFVVMLGARTGAPPSGVDLLAIAGYTDTVTSLPGVFTDGQRWAAQVMESHLAYPTLMYFRSSHDYQSWVGTLGTLLDASTLLMTTVQGPHGEARICYNIGRHATHDLAGSVLLTADANCPGIERTEFDAACEKLLRAGYTLRDRDTAWEQFSNLRATYAPHLNALAEMFEIPPIQWIGDRGSITGPH